VSWVVSVIEDDEAIRSHLAEVLRARGLNVLEASHGEEALTLLRRRGIRPSLMVVDLMMPVMDGWEFLKEGGPLLNGVPVFVVTAFPESRVPEGAMALLKKPVNLHALMQTLEQHCG
jgi:CheY-like chemotaxis protein